MKRRYIIIGLFCIWIALLAINHYRSQWHSDDLIRAQQATIARQQLIIDSLRNPVDTTQFLTEHSEITR